MALWTKITEGVVCRKNTNINVPEMDDLEAQMAINEALYEAGAAHIVSVHIAESITEFGVMADQRNFSAMEYIIEAFSVGGFFKKILDFLKKMWNTIANYFKALIGNKLGASGNIMKLLKKLAELEQMLEAKIASGEIKDDDEIKVKNYRLKPVATVASTLINPKTYLDTSLIDTPTSDVFSKGLNIIKLTEYAASLAGKVREYQKEGSANRATASDLGNEISALDKVLADVKSLTSKLSLGDKGAVESLVIILEKVWKNNTELKKIFEDSKAKDAKTSTDLIRTLLGHLFPNDAAVVNKKAKEVLDSFKFDFEGGGDTAANVSDRAAAGLSVIALTDPIKAALTLVTDILDQLNKAGQDIANISAGDRPTGTNSTSRPNDNDPEGAPITTPGTKSDDQSKSEEYARKMTELGNEMSKVSSNMQTVVTKGMDAGAVLLETGLKESVAQYELAIKSGTGSRKAAKLEAAK